MSPTPVNEQLSREAQAALDALLQRDDPSIVGVVLTGSAARGLATSRSDVDVIVVRDESLERTVSRSSAIDEIPMTLAELERSLPAGSEWMRWQFAWAQVLRDDTNGRVSAAVKAHATLTAAEQTEVLVDRSRLDEFINFAYRTLKSHRDGRTFEARLDSAESIASLVDVVFAFEGRVRPYNKYLRWELREHPLASADWQREPFARRIDGLLDGSEAVMRETFNAIERSCRRFDAKAGSGVLMPIVEAWGTADLILLRGD